MLKFTLRYITKLFMLFYLCFLISHSIKTRKIIEKTVNNSDSLIMNGRKRLLTEFSKDLKIRIKFNYKLRL